MAKPYECYDCGSRDPQHHTAKCELCDPCDSAIVRDLPAIGQTQWWTESRMAKYTVDGVTKAPFNALMAVVVNSQTELPGVGALNEQLT